MATPRLPVFEPNPLWQRAREPIFWLDPALKLAWVNRAWEELTGYPAEAVVGLTCQAHAPSQPGDVSDLAASFHPPPESMAGRPAGGPTLIYRADGERLWRRLEFWPFCDEQRRADRPAGDGPGRGRRRRASPIRRTAGSTPSCWRSADGCRSGTASTR